VQSQIFLFFGLNHTPRIVLRWLPLVTPDQIGPGRGLQDKWTLRLAGQQPVAGQVGADCSNDKPIAAMSLEQS